jgi:hypothetical protein
MEFTQEKTTKIENKSSNEKRGMLPMLLKPEKSASTATTWAHRYFQSFV